jgi:hypothetical protein
LKQSWAKLVKGAINISSFQACSEVVVLAEAGIQPGNSSGRAADRTVFASTFCIIPTGLSRAGFPPPRERQLFMAFFFVAEGT